MRPLLLPAMRRKGRICRGLGRRCSTEIRADAHGLLAIITDSGTFGEECLDGYAHVMGRRERRSPRGIAPKRESLTWGIPELV
jgi:hypothetical protein